ncbi:MAG: hypothetical protein LBF72_00305 [Holosporales bacterium]|nr:hypothetical protein [Holosporales bacterium]
MVRFRSVFPTIKKIGGRRYVARGGAVLDVLLKSNIEATNSQTFCG